jgi:hypothetical protein
MSWFKAAVGLDPDPLDDPMVEWRVWESTGVSGQTNWNWRVGVGDKHEQNYEFNQAAAINRARDSARRMIGQGISIGKTRPCPLCGKPSQVGKETDTAECARLLASARAELPKSVL